MKYEIKSNEHVIVITLWDKGFSTFCEAISEVVKKKKEYKDKKVLMMQSMEKENEPMKIVIVFEF